MTVDLDARSLRGLDRALDALRAEFNGHVPVPVIDQVVGQAMARFSSARIGLYVPILVVRLARERLRELSASGQESGRRTRAVESIRTL